MSFELVKNPKALTKANLVKAYAELSTKYKSAVKDLESALTMMDSSLTKKQVEDMTNALNQRIDQLSCELKATQILVQESDEVIRELESICNQRETELSASFKEIYFLEGEVDKLEGELQVSKEETATCQCNCDCFLCKVCRWFKR